MYDLSLVLESFSSVFRSCSTDVKFATFSSVLHLDAKVQLFSELCKYFTNYFSKNRKKNRRAANDNFAGREPQHLSILSVSRLLLRSSFSLCCFWYTFLVRYPPFCPRNIQVLTSSIFPHSA